MPRASGVYTLPAGTIVTAGTTIQPSQHNPAMEDIAAALTGSVPVDGSAPMTAPLKAADGSAASPALTFNSNPTMGVYKTATPGIGFSVGGVAVFELTAAGPVVLSAFTVPGTMTAALYRASALGTAGAPAFSFTADTDTGFFSAGANTVSVTTSGTERIRFTDAAVPILPLYAVGFPDGAVGSPSLTFGADTDTGFYRSGANTISVTTSSAERMRWTASDIQNVVPLRIPNGSAGAASISPSGDNATGIFSPGSNSFAFTSSGAERLRISNGSGQPVIGVQGDVRIIGTSAGSSTTALLVTNSSVTTTLSVRDDSYVQIPGAYAFTSGISPNFVIDSDGGLKRFVSSRRYKEDIRDYAGTLDAVDKLRPVTFKSKGDDPHRYVGFIAEEVHDAGLTEFVVYDADGAPDALHYTHMIPLLVGALKEASAKIEALSSRIEALEA